METFCLRPVIPFYVEQFMLMRVLVCICIVNVLVDSMKFKYVVVGLLSSLSVSALANDLVNITPVVEKESGCASIVCKNVILEQSVTKAGKFPERSGNETLSAIGDVLFIAGEIGLAENLQEEDTNSRDIDQP